MTFDPRIVGAAIVFALASIFPAQAAQLVMVDQRGCSYCVRFNKELAPAYASTPAGQIAPLRRVSPFKKWPADLANIKPITFTPVFILIDDGREVGRFFGYNGAENFWSQLNPLLAKLG
jgi:thioredoxin-related protein